MNAPVGSTFSEADIEQLAARLAQNKNPAALSLEGVDGLFCALVASPEMVPPSEYLPIIFGGEAEDSQALADLDDANVTIGLLMRYWNSIIADFERESIHLPYLVDVEPAAIPGREWARGFLRGTRLAPEGWSELWNNEDEAHLIVIPLVAGEMDPDWPKEPLIQERSDELLQSMFAGAARAYRHFAEARREFADGFVDDDDLDDDELEDDDYYPEPYVRTEPKIGRNEPCPCGSGKKYKKCCGAG